MKDVLGAAFQGIISVVLLAPFYYWMSLRRKRPPAKMLKRSYDEMRQDD